MSVDNSNKSISIYQIHFDSVALLLYSPLRQIGNDVHGFGVFLFVHLHFAFIFCTTNIFNIVMAETKNFEISYKLSSNQCWYSPSPKHGISAILQPGDTKWNWDKFSPFMRSYSNIYICKWINIVYRWQQI